MAATNRFEDGWWQSIDGLKLHYRDYQSGTDGLPPILCVPGLTRNARDFEAVASRLLPAWRVICVDLRGRGESQFATDPTSYQPSSYLTDVNALLVKLGLRQVVWFGTSLGGILAMLMAATTPERLRAVLLNDIGPAIEPGGMARIRAYVGKTGSWPTWLHAARGLAELQGDVFPRHGLEDWLATAKRLCRLTSAGRITFDYDMRIAEPIRDAPVDGPPLDLWPAFESLAGRPVALVRGARSDLLSVATSNEMWRRLPGLDIATVPDVGHAPLLQEPEAIAAIDRLLDRVATGQ